MTPPLAIDLFCGLGGWTEGLLAEGFDVIGFDVEQHIYGEHRYPAQLVLQDVRTIHGSQFKNAALIVASPPCQEFSYMAMPWTRAKQIARALRGQDEFPAGYTGSRTTTQLTSLFDACFRIQREACEASGRFIPLVVENVVGAQKWAGPAKWRYGSYYLWGDVPALMPMTFKALKVPGFRFDGSGGSFQTASVEGVKVSTMGKGWYPPSDPRHVPGLAFNGHAERAIKNAGGSWFAVAHNGASGKSQNARDMLVAEMVEEGVKQPGLKGQKWFDEGLAAHGSKSTARKAASARIAKIPEALARHIAQVYYPTREAVA